MENQVNHNNQEPTTVQSTPSTQRNTVSLVIVGVTMLLVGLGGGYILFANKNNDMNSLNEKVAQVSPSPIQEAPTSAPTTIQTPSAIKITNTPQVNGVGSNLK